MIDAQPVYTKQMHSKASQRTHTTNGLTSQTHPLHQKLLCRLLENSTTMFGGVVSVDADGCDCARIVRKWYHDDRRYKNRAPSRSAYPKSHLASAGRLPVNEFAANTPAAKYANWYSEYMTVEFSIRRYPKTPVGVGNSKEKWATRISIFRTETCDREAVCPVNIRRLRVRYDSCDSRRLRRKTKLVFADSRLRAIIIANESDLVVKSHKVENE